MQDRPLAAWLFCVVWRFVGVCTLELPQITKMTWHQVLWGMKMHEVSWSAFDYGKCLADLQNSNSPWQDKMLLLWAAKIVQCFLLIGAFPVTFSRWRKAVQHWASQLVKTNGCGLTRTGTTLAVTSVSWLACGSIKTSVVDFDMQVILVIRFWSLDTVVSVSPHLYRYSLCLHWKITLELTLISSLQSLRGSGSVAASIWFRQV